MLTGASRLSQIFEGNRQGWRLGVYSVCCAHPSAIRPALALASARGQVAVIESTCNQVNQDGGYTGMTPAAFAHQVKAMALDAGLPGSDLVLGGDHLGPQPWRALPAAAAMIKAVAMIEAYASAGYGKLHLDCSMPCGEDPAALDDDVIAQRAAQLAAAAEAVTAHAETRPVYVIGTEVPAPGGMGEGHAITPTAPESVKRTWSAHRRAFAELGLEDAFARVIAIVVQPGLDFGNEEVVAFEAGGAVGLAEVVLDLERVVYEAHSTDYQAPPAYAALIDQHFAILKVGPAATFALREGIYALEAVAREMSGWDAQSSVRAALEAAMLHEPKHWASHYTGDSASQARLRHFSYSDRIRYYWTDPAVEHAVDALFAFLLDRGMPLPLVSQCFPQHLPAIVSGALAAEPAALIDASIQLALAPYADACGDHSAARAEA